jgi:hypothetical protein
MIERMIKRMVKRMIERMIERMIKRMTERVWLDGGMSAKVTRLLDDPLNSGGGHLEHAASSGQGSKQIDRPFPTANDAFRVWGPASPQKCPCQTKLKIVPYLDLYVFIVMESLEVFNPFLLFHFLERFAN